MNRYAKSTGWLLSALTLSSLLMPASASTLFLVGGGMQSCTSQNLKACDRSALDPLALRQAKSRLMVALTPQAIQRAAQPAHWLSEQDASQARHLLAALAQDLGTDPVSKADFRDALVASPEGERWYHSLSDRQWALLIDRLEAPQVGRDGERLRERVWLEANRDPHTPGLVARFIELAARAGGLGSGQARPTIVVMTSSARDPFEAHDFYLSLFASQGAEVHWLPLDASVQAARQANQCSQLERFRQTVQGNADRARVYPQLAAQQQQFCFQPERELTLLNQADGLFINGGDQWLTWQALRLADGSDSEALTLIKRRVAEGTLVVGGTSAGTAVQSGPVMISNGSNERALSDGPVQQPPPERDCDGSETCNGLYGDSLTYDARGGLGLFADGITDTHFSERGRQVRLATLANHTLQPLAIGVDENTALVIEDDQWQVVGAGGVWVWQSARSASHYLQPGDRARWHEGRLSVTLAAPLPSSPRDADAPLVRPLELDNHDYRRLANELCVSSQRQALGQVQQQRRQYGVVLTASEQTRFGKGPAGRCSYTDLTLSLGEAAPAAANSN